MQGPLQLTFYKSTKSFVITAEALLVAIFLSLPSQWQGGSSCSPSSLPHPFFTPDTWNPNRAPCRSLCTCFAGDPESTVLRMVLPRFPGKKNEEGNPFSVAVIQETCKVLSMCHFRWEAQRLRCRGHEGPPHSRVVWEGKDNDTHDRTKWCPEVYSESHRGSPL